MSGFATSVPPPLRALVDGFDERVAADERLAAAVAGLDPAALGQLARVVAVSDFFAGALARDPDVLVRCLAHADTVAATAADYARRVAATTDLGEAQRLLREWRRRELARIVWRAVNGLAAVGETLAAVSDLADGCIRAATAAARASLERVFGPPTVPAGEPEPFIVLGMGKLGGRELNFSSDVDLVFLYGASGETAGPRRIDAEEYFQRLGRELIRLLDARTEDGFVFRVDMRLRPFGESGPLAVSVAALEDYLQQHGRDWERYAWIKARAIVGEAAYAPVREGCVRPFVYRRYLDFGVFESLRDMKAMIEREVSRRSLDEHLKLGPGGIREIEFIVQSLQLVRGGGDPRLQDPSLLQVLPRLAGSKLLAEADVAELADAYAILRRAENALQMLRDEQTHTLPEDPVERLRIAWHLGFADWPALRAHLDAARSRVARQFAALVFAGASPPGAESATGAGAAAGEQSLAWLASDAIDAREELLAIGFPAQECESAAVAVDAYRRSGVYRRLDEAGRRRAHAILGRLLLAARRRPAAATVVARSLRVLEAIGTRSSYLALLREQPAALDRLMEVCAVSGFLAAQIAEFPLLLDELIDPNAFAELPSRAGFVRELAARTERMPQDDPEREVEALREFQKVAVFSVALADLTGRLPLMRVSDRLTDIAELILQCCVDLAWRQMTGVYGEPWCAGADGRERPVRVAVAGYGKLGGLELGYGSDLDLVFLHDSSGEAGETRGPRPLDNAVFLVRLGQRIVHLLTMHSAAGRLYEVDMRLRPNGRSGFLMTGIDAFERYQREEAWSWEHQALLRARAVAGDAALCERFEGVRRDVLCHAVRRERLREDVAEMRERMRRELGRGGAGQFDVKQDPGGIADIEFLVQYWILASAGEHPALLAYSDNVRQLEGLAAVGVIDTDTAEWLKAAYVDYRMILHRLALEGVQERLVDAAAHAAQRARILAIWNDTFAGAGGLAPRDPSGLE